MRESCEQCGSYAFNLHKDGIDQHDLCDMHYWQKAAEEAIPALDLLQKRLEAGAYIEHQDGRWWLFTKDGDGITSGESIRSMLVNLIFLDC